MNIAKYISERDNFETDPEDIYCTYGGIDAYHHTLGLIFNKGDEVNFNFKILFSQQISKNFFHTEYFFKKINLIYKT